MPESITRGKRGVAAVGIVIGVVYAAFGFVHGQVVHGLTGLVIILAFLGLLLGLSRRSEAAQLLVAEPSDERQAQITRNASAVVGQVMAGVLTLWWLVAIADDAAYLGVLTTLMGVLGFTFIGATVWFTTHG